MQILQFYGLIYIQLVLHTQNSKSITSSTFINLTEMRASSLPGDSYLNLCYHFPNTHTHTHFMPENKNTWKSDHQFKWFYFCFCCRSFRFVETIKWFFWNVSFFSVVGWVHLQWVCVCYVYGYSVTMSSVKLYWMRHEMISKHDLHIMWKMSVNCTVWIHWSMHLIKTIYACE